MMKTQLGLGILSMPSILDTLGLIPGILCIFAISAITTWSNYIVGAFKLRHPDVYGIDDAGYMMFGRIGREILGGTYCLCEFFSPVGFPTVTSNTPQTTSSSRGPLSSAYLLVSMRYLPMVPVLLFLSPWRPSSASPFPVSEPWAALAGSHGSAWFASLLLVSHTASLAFAISIPFSVACQ